MKKVVITIGFILGGFGLISCSSEPKRLDLEGERISILSHEENFVAAEVKNANIELPSPSPLSNWTMAGGNSTHNTGNIAFAGKDNELWSASIGTANSSDKFSLAAPVVINDKVFTIDANAVVSAFLIERGDRVWQTPLADIVKNPLSGEGIAYGSDMLFAITGGGKVVALNTSDGSLIWQQSFNIGLRTAPTYKDGKLFVMTTDNRLLTLNAKDGGLLWNYDVLADDTILLGMPAPTITNKIALATFSTGEIVALKINNGIPVWSNELSPFNKNSIMANLSAVKARAVVDENTVYVAASNSILSLSLTTGDIQWEKRIGTPAQPYIAGDYIFLFSSANELIALDKNKGKILWVTPFDIWENVEDKEDKITYTEPILAGNYLYFANSKGELIKVNPKDGQKVKTIDIGVGSIISPIVADNKMFLIDTNGNLKVFE